MPSWPASVETRHRLQRSLIWVAYLSSRPMPAVCGGVPLGPIDAAALLAIALAGDDRRAAAGRGRCRHTPCFHTRCGRCDSGEGGFRSRYFANAAATGAHERSTEYPDDAFTRIDGRLQFDSPAQFPLPFFNDNSRFNFYKVGEPNRRLLDFAVRWSGLWWVDRERPTVYLDAPGATSEVFVDGQPMMALGPSG